MTRDPVTIFSACFWAVLVLTVLACLWVVW
jgi:hypothetical protein